MKLAYIAGPYRADTVAGIRQNIEAARQVAEKYWKLGYGVFCPHLNSAHMDGICSDENFLEAGLLFLWHCDVIVMMVGWKGSAGAIAELNQAEEKGLEVIFE